MGVCLNPSHTDVLAAEAARKQASALFLPHLLLFFFLFCLSFFHSPSSCSLIIFCLSSILPSALVVLLLPSHLDDYSKIKGLEKL